MADAHTDGDAPAPTAGPDLADRHLRLGWWGLVVFASVGVVLEALHGLKVGWYLDVGEETRRLLLTLGHAHGTLFSLVHLAFAATASHRPNLPRAATASGLLTAAWILVPGGFLLGGAFPYGGDPGVAVFAVPVGAALFVAGLLLTALGISRR